MTYGELPLGLAAGKTSRGTGRKQIIEGHGELATCLAYCFNKFGAEERDDEEWEPRKKEGFLLKDREHSTLK